MGQHVKPSHQPSGVFRETPHIFHISQSVLKSVRTMSFNEARKHSENQLQLNSSSKTMPGLTCIKIPDREVIRNAFPVDSLTKVNWWAIRDTKSTKRAISVHTQETEHV